MALTLSRNALACGLEGQESLASPALMLKIYKVSTGHKADGMTNAPAFIAGDLYLNRHSTPLDYPTSSNS